METDIIKKKQLPAVIVLSLGYLIAISLGTLLLMLPWAVQDGSNASYSTITDAASFFEKLVNTFLTATSATCVTGIIAYDNYVTWTLFGQIVILVLIQIGGVGFMTVITLFFMIFGKKVSLYEKGILMQSAGSYTISDVMKVIKTIVFGTLIVEAIGAGLLFLRFREILPANGYPDYSDSIAVYYAIFHSISAFCNAGFDLCGFIEPMSSLTHLYNDVGLNFIIMGLIVIGSLGFIVWIDILKNGFHFSKYQLHTKIVLVSTFIIIISSAALYFIFEYNNTSLPDKQVMGNMDLPEKLLASLFMAITPRTAGFNTISMNALTPSSKLLTIVLMFIGGNSGSTAGGVKVTTIIVVLFNLFDTARNKKETSLFKRRISSGVVKQASALFLAYILIIIGATLIVSMVEGLSNHIFSLEDIIVEITSALCTVGICIMDLAGTTILTRIILIFLMYIGRLGALTLFSLLLKEQKESDISRPEGNILVG